MDPHRSTKITLGNASRKGEDMSLLSKLFGGGSGAAAPKAEPVEYKGFAIIPAPAKEGGRYRIGAEIEKDGKQHHLIRADTLDDLQSAEDASVNKAKQLIDQVGDRLFD